MKKHVPVSITIPADRWESLAVLGDPAEVVGLLINHTCAGILAPGSWQRLWICQAFCDDWPEVDIEQRIREIYHPTVRARKAVEQ